MARHVARWELAGVGGPVVVVDVIRAFTTAAYAFGSGAAEIYLVDDVEEALVFKDARPGTIALGENRGLRPAGFDFPNSPAMVSRVDLTGRTLVQRTSAGTRGVVSRTSVGASALPMAGLFFGGEGVGGAWIRRLAGERGGRFARGRRGATAKRDGLTG